MIMRLITYFKICNRTLVYQWRIQGFFGCPETPPPPAKFFFNQAVDAILAPTFTSHLNLRVLETPLGPTLDTPLFQPALFTVTSPEGSPRH